MAFWFEINPQSRRVSHGLLDHLDMFTGRPSAFWWGLALFAAIVWLSMFLFRNPRKLVEQSIRQQTADIPTGNYLFLRCSGDEAAAALSAAQFIAWVGTKVSNILHSLIRPLLTSGGAIKVVRGFLASLLVLSIAGVGWTATIPYVVKYGVFRFFFSPNGPFLGDLNPVAMAFYLVFLSCHACLSSVCWRHSLFSLHRRSPHGLSDGRSCLRAF